jgi:hypothetical protein
MKVPLATVMQDDWIYHCIRLPLRLVSEANARGHWSKGAKRAKEQRGVAMLACVGLVRNIVDKPIGAARVTITRISPRSLDGDNLQRSAKATRDGIADALGIDDGDARLEWRYAQRRGLRGEYAVEIVIETRGEG